MDQTNRENMDLETSVFQEILNAITSVIGEQGAALHEPNIGEQETIEILKCLDNGFVSSAGPAISQFEESCWGRVSVVAVCNWRASLVDSGRGKTGVF